MQMTLLGYKALDFESNGERVQGTQAFVAYTEDGVEGQRTDKLFFKSGKSSFEIPELQVGATLDVTFNRRGKPEKVTVVPSAQRLNLSK